MLILSFTTTAATAGLHAALWCAFGTQLHRAAHRRNALAALATVARNVGDPQGAALALMANTLVHLLDALGLLEDATAAEGASAAESIARALCGGAAHAPGRTGCRAHRHPRAGGCPAPRDRPGGAQAGAGVRCLA